MNSGVGDPEDENFDQSDFLKLPVFCTDSTSALQVAQAEQ
jgi:hypothetical protein